MTHEAIHSWLVATAPAVRDHLVDATIFLLALLAVSMLPVLHARTRHALVVLGVARFFIPGAAISMLASGLTAGAVELPSFSVTAALGLPAGASSRSEVLCVAAALWIGGALVLALRALVAQLRWRTAARRAEAASAREVETMRRVAAGSGMRGMPHVVRSSAGGPVTAGFFRPVVLLPATCADELDDDELAAVLAHELRHVERRHNLAGVVLSAATSLFWFHPALWFAASRVHAEAERDCDERALHFVSDPPRYFSGMLKVCHGFIAPRPAGVSCMSTARLKERMDHLMKHHESRRRSVPHRLAFAAGIAALALTTVFVSAGTPSADVAGGDQGATTDPKLVTRVEPVYPESAREKGVQGMVVMETAIDRKGNVTAVKVLQGIDDPEGKALEEAAMTAVKQWKFEPATKDGKPVAVKYNVTVRFKLH